MKNNIFFILTILMIVIANNISAQGFYLNSLGYLPKEEKIITVSPDVHSFKLVEANTGNIVFEGNTSDTVSQADVGMTVRRADVSSVTTPGEYYLQANDSLKSPQFLIAPDVYNFAFKTTIRAFYLWRCGTAVEGNYNGIHFSHDACHIQDGGLDSIGYANQQKDGTGGWHDAGDYGKYVVNAGITIGLLFMAWDQFGDKIKNISLDLPETAPGYPGYLEELKWETDWLLKMVYPDGSGKVSHKLTRTNFSGFIKPEDDLEKRYFTGWSSAATADFVGIMAQAARYFKPYDAEYAQKCLDAAWLSYSFLKDNPAFHSSPWQGFRTGAYYTNDEDDRLWAAAEMWETTGDTACLSDFETRFRAIGVKVEENWDWGNIQNMGTFTYILSRRKGKDPEVLDEAKKQVIEVADRIVEKAKKDIFNRPLGNKYYWGCNGTVARQVLNLQVANQVSPNVKYVNTALDAVHNLFGCNQYGRSFVTGLGFNPPMNPHDRRSGSDDIIEPWPGYIVGGGTKPTDWLDEERSFSTNEIAINWQAALVYALAGFIQ